MSSLTGSQALDKSLGGLLITFVGLLCAVGYVQKKTNEFIDSIGAAISKDNESEKEIEEEMANKSGLVLTSARVVGWAEISNAKYERSLFSSPIINIKVELNNIILANQTGTKSKQNVNVNPVSKSVTINSVKQMNDQKVLQQKTDVKKYNKIKESSTIISGQPNTE